MSSCSHTAGTTVGRRRSAAATASSRGLRALRAQHPLQREYRSPIDVEVVEIWLTYSRSDLLQIKEPNRRRGSRSTWAMHALGRAMRPGGTVEPERSCDRGPKTGGGWRRSPD